MATTRRRAKGSAPRYSLDACVIEFRKMLEAEGLQDKEVALECGITPPQFSHKMANTGKSSFSVEELGRIAAYFAERTRRLLPGWPFVSERECAMLEAALRGERPQART